MPAPAIVGAVVAAGIAMEATTTAVMVFSIAASIGSAAAAVGQITGSKELTIAGTVLGAVGAVGGLASSAGLLGEAGSFFGMGGAEGVTNAAGGGAANVASAAAGEVAPVAAPTGGYTWNAVQATDPSLASVPSDVISQASGGTSNIVDTIAGTVSQAPLAEAPQVAAGAQVEVSPATATNTTVNPDALVPDPSQTLASNPENLVPDPAKGLIDQTGAVSTGPTGDMVPTVTAEAATPLDAYGNPIAQGSGGPAGSPADMMPRDEFGNIIEQGQGAGGTLSTTNNPGAPPTNATSSPGQPTPEVVTGAPTNASVTPGSTADPSIVGRQVLSNGKPVTIGANPILDGGLPGSGDLTRVALANKPPVPVDGGSVFSNIWKFTKDNPMVTMGGLMAASSFLSGAMSPLTPAQTKALDSQAQQNLAAANLANTQNELLQRRLDNMRQGIPQARWKNGLINMPPVNGGAA